MRPRHAVRPPPVFSVSGRSPRPTSMEAEPLTWRIVGAIAIILAGSAVVSRRPKAIAPRADAVRPADDVVDDQAVA